MHLQRAGTVKAGRTQTVKWAAEGARKGSNRVFCDVRHTSVAGNMLVFRREQGVSPEPRWHRGTVSVLDMYSCHGRIFCTPNRNDKRNTPSAGDICKRGVFQPYSIVVKSYLSMSIKYTSRLLPFKLSYTTYIKYPLA